MTDTFPYIGKIINGPFAGKEFYGLGREYEVGGPCGIHIPGPMKATDEPRGFISWTGTHWRWRDAEEKDLHEVEK